jgi:hypothetical protein
LLAVALNDAAPAAFNTFQLAKKALGHFGLQMAYPGERHHFKVNTVARAHPSSIHQSRPSRDEIPAIDHTSLTTARSSHEKNKSHSLHWIPSLILESGHELSNRYFGDK